MRKSSRQAAKRAAKAKLSGAIPAADAAPNKKIVFGDHDDDDGSVDDALRQMEAEGVEGDDNGSADDAEGGEAEGDDAEVEKDEEDDAVEEVKGSAARASTRRLRDAERTMAAEAIMKKKRKKKDITPEVADVESESSGSEEEEEGPFADDFFEAVDAARADRKEQVRREKRQKKVQQKKRMGKHTTFVVEDKDITTGAPHRLGQNIEVVPLGGGEPTDANNDDAERQLLLSATLGAAPSKSAVVFARGSMTSGTSKERSAESRQRKTKNDETWKRSRKMNGYGMGARAGRAAPVFVCKKR